MDTHSQADPSLVHLFKHIFSRQIKESHVCTVDNNILKPSHIDKWLNQANRGIITTHSFLMVRTSEVHLKSFLRFLSNNALFLTADTESYSRRSNLLLVTDIWNPWKSIFTIIFFLNKKKRRKEKRRDNPMEGNSDYKLVPGGYKVSQRNRGTRATCSFSR